MPSRSRIRRGAMPSGFCPTSVGGLLHEKCERAIPNRTSIPRHRMPRQPSVRRMDLTARERRTAPTRRLRTRWLMARERRRAPPCGRTGQCARCMSFMLRAADRDAESGLKRPWAVTYGGEAAAGGHEGDAGPDHDDTGAAAVHQLQLTRLTNAHSATSVSRTRAEPASAEMMQTPTVGGAGALVPAVTALGRSGNIRNLSKSSANFGGGDTHKGSIRVKKAHH